MLCQVRGLGYAGVPPAPLLNFRFDLTSEAVWRLKRPQRPKMGLRHIRNMRMDM